MVKAFFEQRSLSIIEAFRERNSNWMMVFRPNLELLIGHGIGSGGHRVMSEGNFYILDGYYFKNIYEIGLIGAFILGAIIIPLVMKGISQKYYLRVLIVGIVMLTSLGSSALSFQYITPLFWFVMGDIYYENRQGKH